MPSLREHFSAKRKTHRFKGKNPLRPRTPTAVSLLRSRAAQLRHPLPRTPNLVSSSRPRAPTAGRVWGGLDAALDSGLSSGCSTEARPLFPYRGLGYVAALGDILAVLLVSHTDPLFGDHLRGATTNPNHLLASLAPPLTAATPRSRCRAAGTGRFSGGRWVGPERCRRGAERRRAWAAGCLGTWARRRARLERGRTAGPEEARNAAAAAGSVE